MTEGDEEDVSDARRPIYGKRGDMRLHTQARRVNRTNNITSIIIDSTKNTTTLYFHIAWYPN